MSNYSKATNFAIKDSLSTGNPSKIIKGTEVNTEFDSNQSAVNSKADANNGAHTGTATMVNLTLSGTFTGTIDGGTF